MKDIFNVYFTLKFELKSGFEKHFKQNYFKTQHKN